MKKYFIKCKLIYLLKSCIEAYKVIPKEIFNNNFIEEIKKELNNLTTGNYEELKRNWENEYKILIDNYNDNIDSIISKFYNKIQTS